MNTIYMSLHRIGSVEVEKCKKPLRSGGYVTKITVLDNHGTETEITLFHDDQKLKWKTFHNNKKR